MVATCLKRVLIMKFESDFTMIRGLSMEFAHLCPILRSSSSTPLSDQGQGHKGNQNIDFLARKITLMHFVRIFRCSDKLIQRKIRSNLSKI